VTARASEPAPRLTLREARQADLDVLRGWFPDAATTTDWGGPEFRFPHTAASFREDCCWDRLAGFALSGPDGTLEGFGQLYDHLGRIHLARLAVRPDRRGQGVGKALIRALLDAGRQRWPYEEASLYVFRHNARACACYRALGFRAAPFPAERARFADTCWFLTRPVVLSAGTEARP
jgi:ribosomal protein S18 acetylase RimI-like enzyme